MRKKSRVLIRYELDLPSSVFDNAYAVSQFWRKFEAYKNNATNMNHNANYQFNLDRRDNYFDRFINSTFYGGCKSFVTFTLSVKINSNNDIKELENTLMGFIDTVGMPSFVYSSSDYDLVNKVISKHGKIMERKFTLRGMISDFFNGKYIVNHP